MSIICRVVDQEMESVDIGQTNMNPPAMSRVVDLWPIPVVATEMGRSATVGAMVAVQQVELAVR